MNDEHEENIPTTASLRAQADALEREIANLKELNKDPQSPLAEGLGQRIDELEKRLDELEKDLPDF